MDHIEDFDFEESFFFEAPDDIANAQNAANNMGAEDNFRAAGKHIQQMFQPINTSGSTPNLSQINQNVQDRVTHYEPAVVHAGTALNQINTALDSTFGTSNNASIFARAKRLLLQFPVYMSESVDFDTASILTQYIEIYYAAIVQMMMSTRQYIDLDQANDMSFMTDLHTNIKESLAEAVNSKEYGDLLRNPFDVPINEMDAIIQNAYSNEIPLTENMSLLFRALPTDENDEMCIESRRLARDSFEGLRYLQELNVAEPGRVVNTTSTTTDNSKDKSEQQEVPMSNNDPNWDTLARQALALQGNTNPNGAEINRAIDDVRRDIRMGNIPGYTYANGQYYRQTVKNSREQQSTTTSTTQTGGPLRPIEGPERPTILKDNEIRKINAMAPFRMAVTFRVKLPNGGVDRDITYVVGVKGILHPIQASDLDDELYDIVTGGVNKFQKVRYKSGEISLSDFLFDIKGLKKDATASIDYNKRWITTLKRLADGAKLGNTFLQIGADLLHNGSTPIPNGTLILTDSNVNDLKGTTGIDLNQLDKASKLCKNLFLISLIIITPATATMKIFTPDNVANWEYMSMKTIQNEVNKAENSEMSKALQKFINR